MFLIQVHTHRPTFHTQVLGLLASALPSAIMADPDARQAWLVSVPRALSEEELIATLGQYGVRPYKVVLRRRGEGQASLTYAASIV